MPLDRETLDQLLETVRRFVRERLVPNEHRVADDDAIPADIVAEIARSASSACRSPPSVAASA